VDAGVLQEAHMKCDLCKHEDVHSENSRLCESCAEMVQRLLIVKQRMDAHESVLAASSTIDEKRGSSAGKVPTVKSAKP
jgi:hypothetical protein